LELQLFDLLQANLQGTGDWPAPGEDTELVIGLLGPAIRNLTAVVHELQR
jgi:hypothetical protein